MSGFKPGGLAIIIKSNAGNTGKVVELVRPAGDILMNITQERTGLFECWIVRHSPGIVCVHCFGEMEFKTVHPEKEYPKSWMRPLPPEDDIINYDLGELIPIEALQPT
jgi:hypothetical protein